jgi:hypothetical protein
MFAEMLTHYEEKIFLEAIDQYFESELFEDFDTIKQKGILSEKDIIKSEETDSQIDKEKETDIEIMNIKFYEALNIDNNEIRDISTDVESEDNISPEKVVIKISDYLILSKESIEKNKQKILTEYENQIILEEKIKNLFKKDENNNNNNNSIGNKK